MQVVIRTSASHRRGMGHLVRMATLADALRAKGATVHFLINRQGANWLQSRMSDVEMMLVKDSDDELQDVCACKALLGDVTFDWCVVDLYELGAAWEMAMRSHAKRILAIDDIGRAHAADLLSDSKPYAKYKDSDAANFLLGPDYVLLREAFSRLHPQAVKLRNEHLFICFGGSDPTDMTGLTLAALAGKLPADMVVDVVVGANYAQVQTAQKICSAQGWVLHTDHHAPEELMMKASLAIGAGGTMNWERCALALPSIVISIADNQRAQCRYLHEAGAMIWLGDAGDFKQEELVSNVMAHLRYNEKMARIAHAQVDGKGALRVAEAMKGLA